MPQDDLTELDRKIRRLGRQTIDYEEVDRKLREIRERAEAIEAEEVRIGSTRWYQLPIVALNRLRR